MRKLATIQLIEDIQPIEGADKIEKIRIKDWWCVAKKDEFKKGSLCIYFEIDSLLPVDNPIFSFLEKGNKPKKMNIEGKEYIGYRLRTVKLRGQISQGLALPLPIEKISELGIFYIKVRELIGLDISEKIGIVKYEPPIPACLAGKIKGLFPGFLRKTDEERVQNLGEFLKLYKDTPVYITEKLDGTSTTYYKKDGIFGVCSRNLELLDSPGNTQWEIARKYDLENKIPDGFAIQGEIVGSGIQGNPLKLNDQDFFIFNLFDITEQRFLNFTDLEMFCDSLSLRMVPVLTRATKLSDSVDALLQEANGKSLILPSVDREGIVVRSVEEMKVTMNKTISRFSFKAISNNYLLNEKE